MLTTRGRTVLGLAAGSFIVGRLLALRELHMVAAALGALLVTALATALLRRGVLTVRRRIAPSRTVVGGEVRADLAVRNAGRIGAGPVLLEDRIPPRLNVAARLGLPSLPAQSERSVAYLMRPALRGRYTLGPLDVVMADPFGLVARRQEIPGTSHLVVYPAYERLRTLPRESRRAGGLRRSPLLGQGDEFYALRGYQDGDDLRKVHWPSSLKQGEIVIRQEELLREPGLLIVLDTCAAKHAGARASSSLEAAVSACASVSLRALRQDTAVSILTGDGTLLRSRRPSEDEVLEALAVAEASANPNLIPALELALRRGQGGAALVMITPGLSGPELARARELAAGAAGGASVLVAASTFADAPGLASERALRRSEAALGGLGLPVVRLQAGRSFADAWEKGVRRVAVAR